MRGNTLVTSGDNHLYCRGRWLLVSVMVAICTIGALILKGLIDAVEETDTSDMNPAPVIQMHVVSIVGQHCMNLVGVILIATVLGIILPIRFRVGDVVLHSVVSGIVVLDVGAVVTLFVVSIL